MILSADHLALFRLRMPRAEAVAVEMEGMKAPLPMRRGAQGVWTLEIGPLRPDIYGYDFLVDGTAIADPSNPMRKPNLLSTESTFLVPGSPPRLWEPADVPHGEVHRCYYHSAACGDDRDYLVYTPPAYTAAAGKRWPLLCLLHGYSDDAAAWVEYGRANFIFDRLIAAGRMVPAVVLMPLGYGSRDILAWRGPGRWPQEMMERNFAQFEAALLGEVLPRVTQTYPLAPDLAIAGLSMGGAEALMVGLGDRGARFAWIGSFSTGGFPSERPHATPEARGRLRLVWIACGTDDGFLGSTRELAAGLRGDGLAVTTVETAGGHSWQVWRRNLIEFAPKLFRPMQTPAP